MVQIIPVAGKFPTLDANKTLLRATDADVVEGVRIELHGDTYQDQRQSTWIDLSCDRSGYV